MQYWYITGTSSGLGKAIAETVLQDNTSVVIGIARHQTIQHANYLHITLDLADLKNTEHFQFAHHDTATRIILINNAGSIGEIKYTGDLSNKNIIDTYILNSITPHVLINTFIHTYKHHPAEKIIVNVTSGAASSAYDGWSVYGASKAAMNMMSLSIAKEFEMQKSNFKIFSIAPNIINTKMQEHIRDSNENDFSRKDKFVALHENDQLYDPYAVAKEYIEMINNANTLHETIYKITL